MAFFQFVSGRVHRHKFPKCRMYGRAGLQFCRWCKPCLPRKADRRSIGGIGCGLVREARCTQAVVVKNSSRNGLAIANLFCVNAVPES